VGLADAELGFAAYFEEAALAEGLEEAIEEDLRLAFFVTRHVVARPLDEGGKALFAEGHGGWIIVRLAADRGPIVIRTPQEVEV
jgi:hypothetical protein